MNITVVTTSVLHASVSGLVTPHYECYRLFLSIGPPSNSADVGQNSADTRANQDETKQKGSSGVAELPGGSGDSPDMKSYDMLTDLPESCVICMDKIEHQLAIDDVINNHSFPILVCLVTRQNQ